MGIFHSDQIDEQSKINHEIEKKLQIAKVIEEKTVKFLLLGEPRHNGPRQNGPRQNGPRQNGPRQNGPQPLECDSVP